MNGWTRAAVISAAGAVVTAVLVFLADRLASWQDIQDQRINELEVRTTVIERTIHSQR